MGSTDYYITQRGERVETKGNKKMRPIRLGGTYLDQIFCEEPTIEEYEANLNGLESGLRGGRGGRRRWVLPGSIVKVTTAGKACIGYWEIRGEGGCRRSVSNTDSADRGHDWNRAGVTKGWGTDLLRGGRERSRSLLSFRNGRWRGDGKGLQPP